MCHERPIRSNPLCLTHRITTFPQSQLFFPPFVKPPSKPILPTAIYMDCHFSNAGARSQTPQRFTRKFPKAKKFPPTALKITRPGQAKPSSASPRLLARAGHPNRLFSRLSHVPKSRRSGSLPPLYPFLRTIVPNDGSL